MTRWLWIAALTVTLALFGVAAALWWSWQWFHAPGQAGRTVVLTIEQGASSAAIAAQLVDSGLIEHPQLWRAGVRWLGVAQRLQAGEYELDSRLSPRALAERFTEGGVIQHRLSFPEGWTAREVLALVRQQEKLVWDFAPDAQIDLGLLRNTLEPARAQAFEQYESYRADGSLEGWLYPDTYQFTAATPASQVLARAWRRMLEVLDETWRERQNNLPFDTAYDLLTLASVVEKETGRAEDRAQIAQVFVRRLLLGMRLQTDPTVIYGLGEAFDGNLTRKHLRTDGPFNTYTRHGLPPTPIAMPGLAALKAAAHPADGDFLYFVARGDGSSEFSRTLDEHEAAVRRFQLKR